MWMLLVIGLGGAAAQWPVIASGYCLLTNIPVGDVDN